MRVLIAEDDFTSRSILTAILKKWGDDPIVTKDGLDAWNVLQQPDAPKLVLLDRDMPGMEGAEVCRLLRKIDSSDPPYVILLTARGEKGDIVQGLDAGANDYIAKPYDNAELQARVGVGRRMLELQARLREARDALAFQAAHDPLTGIFNRRAILDRLKAELSRTKRQNGTLSVGMCDIDHFKAVNDKHGHLTGDSVLRAVATCLASHVRSCDRAYRYGGEEMAVLLPGADEGAAGRTAERLRRAIARLELISEAGQPVPVTISLGIADVAIGEPPSDIEEMISRADQALYFSKESGRNRTSVWRPGGALALSLPRGRSAGGRSTTRGTRSSAGASRR